MKEYQNPEVLRKLYWDDGLSQIKIAKEFGVSKTIISYFMRKFDVPRRYQNKRRLDITKKVLSELYLEKKFSIPKIVKLVDASSATIWKKMKKYGIKMRPRPGRSITILKTPFFGDLEEKAYLLGLRTGDVWSGKIGNQIRMGTGTTHLAQLNMINSVFEKYSRINVKTRTTKRGLECHIECLLDKSFNFLIEKLKELPQWILNNNNCFYAFLAGYTDCEASWSIYNLKDTKYAFAKFQLSTCDKIILQQIKTKLKKFELKPSFGLLRRKGQIGNYGRYKKNLYYLYLSRQEDILKLAKILLKYSRHEEKIWKMKFIIENSGKRWENIKDELFRFKEFVRDTTLNKNPTLTSLSIQHAMKVSDERLY